ncbi:tetraspanin-9 [Bacillus rossius redtenbacheri]|uniref:tetraspanin-9 n=1 Tax=Bacillus rossius redtenbacheri TaxID=93214 RepID=UPI002FDD2319
MGRSGYTCVRHVFCSLNVLMWLAGCGVLGLGVWLRLAYSGYAALLPQYRLLSADSLCLASGVVMFVVAFFGCCGAWFQSRCMLITYFSLVIFMFVAEFLLATLAFVFRENLGHLLRQELRAGIELHYDPGRDPAFAAVWTHIHDEFHCCGVTGYEDWYDIKAWPGEKIVPDSCCLPKIANHTDCGRSRDPDMWFAKGCAEQVQMWFVERLHIVGVVGLVVAFIQLFGLISSMLLFCTVRHKRTSHTYKSYDPTT